HIHFFDPDTELTIMGVPRANRIAAKFLATDDGLVVRFGNIVIPVSNGMAARLTDLEQINRDVTLEIAPDDLMDTEEEGSVKIEGTVDFIEKYPRYTAAYSKVAGKKGFMVSKHPLDSAVAPGDKIVLYVRPEAIQLRDIDQNEKLIAYKPVTNNTATAQILVKDGTTATVQFGKTKLNMITNSEVREPGTAVINIDPRRIRVGKEEVQKAPKMVVVGKVKDADVLGANTIVYADVEGIEGGFCAIVPGTVNYNVNDKVKFVVDPLGITLGTKPSVSAVIAEKVAYAPAYVFVEEKEPEKKVVAPVASEETVATAEAATAAKKPAAKKTTAAKKPAATAAKKPAAKKAAPKK
ncbi:MAG: hypothetical protein K2L51_00165, partial [Clostridiales bacterium]|nr:hypothetical protein [Clostridiales bacterium]